MKECSKSIPRRLASPNFMNRYFVGDGIDIGGGPDPLCLYIDLFCQMRSCRTWEIEDGDAQLLEGVADNSFDFVHSSHCLEHLRDPVEAMRNWLRVVRPGGYLIITVPDEDLYEQGIFPSTYNQDHKWTFTIYKTSSWSKRSKNVLGLLCELGPAAEPIKVELLDATYRYDLPRYDQTLSPVTESGIEIIVRKRPPSEVDAGGRAFRNNAQPSREMRIHLNQYRDDMATLKIANKKVKPFQNDGPV